MRRRSKEGQALGGAAKEEETAAEKAGLCMLPSFQEDRPRLPVVKNLSHRSTRIRRRSHLL